MSQRERIVVEKVAIKLYVTKEEYAEMKKIAARREWTVPHVIRFAIRELLRGAFA